MCEISDYLFWRNFCPYLKPQAYPWSIPVLTTTRKRSFHWPSVTCLGSLPTRCQSPSLNQVRVCSTFNTPKVSRYYKLLTVDSSNRSDQALKDRIFVLLHANCLWLWNRRPVVGRHSPSLCNASKFEWIFCHAVEGMVRKSPLVPNRWM